MPDTPIMEASAKKHATPRFFFTGLKGHKISGGELITRDRTVFGWHILTCMYTRSWCTACIPIITFTNALNFLFIRWAWFFWRWAFTSSHTCSNTIWWRERKLTPTCSHTASSRPAGSRLSQGQQTGTEQRGGWSCSEIKVTCTENENQSLDVITGDSLMMHRWSSQYHRSLPLGVSSWYHRGFHISYRFHHNPGAIDALNMPLNPSLQNHREAHMPLRC